MTADRSRARLQEGLARVARGEETALRDVYTDTAAKLFGILVRILKDRGEAEDVLQEVYLTVWRNAHAFDPARASPMTWLAAIARNRAIDRVRAIRVRPTQALAEDFDIAGSEPSGLDVLVSRAEFARLGNCLAELDPQHGHAIRSAFLNGDTYEEVATRLGKPLGTVKSWIRRGLAKLRVCLEQ